MAELIERTTALVAWHPTRNHHVAAAATAIGIDLPPMGHFIEHAGLLLARIAPTQMLAIQPGTGPAPLEALAPFTPHATLIDLSDSRVAVRFQGPTAREALSRLVPLDLYTFAPGRCAQTLAAHLTVLLLQHDAETFELQCGRSFANTFLRAVQHA